MAAHEETVKGIVSSQQTYAATHDLPAIFEALTLLVIFNKPPNVLEFIAAEAAKLKVTRQFEPPLVSKEVPLRHMLHKQLSFMRSASFGAPASEV